MERESVRDYKFCGKRLDNGELVYGGIYVDEERIGILTTEIIGAAAVIDEVDPATAGQYTGLKDKNGNEVYSDHILSYKPIRYTDCSRTEIAEIGEESLISIITHRPIATVIKPHTKNVRCFGWDQETGEGLILHLESEEIEIVGSIHDNPELLEGGPPDDI